MEKIDTNKIQGHYSNIDLDGNCSGGDDTIKSIKLVADKVNEIVEWINEQENCDNKRFYGVGEHEIYSKIEKNLEDFDKETLEHVKHVESLFLCEHKKSAYKIKYLSHRNDLRNSIYNDKSEKLN